MTNWFGPESWGAPICRDCPRCDVPVGDICGYCSQPITANSHGVTIPAIGFEGKAVAAFHLDCFVGSILAVPQ